MSLLLRTGRRVAATIALAPAEAQPSLKAIVLLAGVARPARVALDMQLKNLTPVIILTGSNDQQAPPEQVSEQKAAFLAAGNRDVTAHVVPGVNHLFVVDADGYPGNYTKVPAPVRIKQEVVGEVVDWLAIRLAVRR